LNFGRPYISRKSTYKSVALLYNNKFDEKETMKMIPFTIDSPKIKDLGINLAKDVKNYKVLEKETEECIKR
jgi:hypothetical protein